MFASFYLSLQHTVYTKDRLKTICGYLVFALVIRVTVMRGRMWVQTCDDKVFLSEINQNPSHSVNNNPTTITFGLMCVQNVVMNHDSRKMSSRYATNKL